MTEQHPTATTTGADNEELSSLSTADLSAAIGTLTREAQSLAATTSQMMQMMQTLTRGSSVGQAGEGRVADRGVLRIDGWGGIPADQTQEMLEDLDNCYNSIFRYEFILNSFSSADPQELTLRLLIMGLQTSPAVNRQFVPDDQRLVLKSVSLGSPGFWEFLGKLNPLEVIRLYLKDRHEQRKDREYRESAEKEKLHLENALKRTQIYGKQYELLKKLKVTDEELAILRNQLLHEPLEQLGRAQDRKLIGTAGSSLFTEDGEYTIASGVSA